MSDPVASAARGAVEGALDWTKQQVEELARRIRDREIAFIEDKPTAEAIRKQSGTSEYKLLIEFIPKGYFRVLTKLGLTLRGMENNQDAVTRFKNGIYDQFGTDGVRIAELVQMGIVTQLLTHLVKLYKSTKDVQKKLLAFFEQADLLSIFVAKEDFKIFKSKSEVVKARVETNPSQMVVVYARGDKAVQVMLKILKDVKSDPRNYIIETQQMGYQLSAFVFAPEVRAKVAGRWDTLTGDV